MKKIVLSLTSLFILTSCQIIIPSPKIPENSKNATISINTTNSDSYITLFKSKVPQHCQDLEFLHFYNKLIINNKKYVNKVNVVGNKPISLFVEDKVFLDNGKIEANCWGGFSMIPKEGHHYEIVTSLDLSKNSCSFKVHDLTNKEEVKLLYRPFELYTKSFLQGGGRIYKCNTVDASQLEEKLRSN
jgi:hypothetical protein